MPSLAEAIGSDRSGYTQIAQGPNPTLVGNESNSQPGFSNFTRCPLPILSNSNTDSLRTYYQGPGVWQTRIYNPQ
jgi:hypothetical protein